MTDTGRVVLTTARLVLREFTAHAGHVTALIRALLDADVQVAASRAWDQGWQAALEWAQSSAPPPSNPYPPAA